MEGVATEHGFFEWADLDQYLFLHQEAEVSLSIYRFGLHEDHMQLRLAVCSVGATVHVNSCEHTARLGSATPICQQHCTQLMLYFTPATESWHPITMNSSTKQIHR